MTKERDEAWKAEPDLHELGRLHAMLPKETQRAIAGLVELAERGSAMSALYLADAYFGRYLPKDLNSALLWYERASEMGSAEADFMIGTIRQKQGNLDAALTAFSRGSGRGHLPSMYRLAVFYREGIGVKVDQAKSAQLMSKAADQGHLFAKRDLATLYLKGRGGRRQIARGIVLLGSLGIDLVKTLANAMRQGRDVDDRMRG